MFFGKRRIKNKMKTLGAAIRADLLMARMDEEPASPDNSTAAGAGEKFISHALEQLKHCIGSLEECIDGMDCTARSGPKTVRKFILAQQQSEQLHQRCEAISIGIFSVVAIDNHGTFLHIYVNLMVCAGAPVRACCTSISLWTCRWRRVGT